MSRLSLPVLPSGEPNPCQDCPSSCCSPVRVGFESNLPLPINDPRQTTKNPKKIAKAWKAAELFISRLIRSNIPFSVDQRLRVEGYFIAPSPSEAVDEIIDEVVTSNRLRVMGMKIIVMLLLKCNAFNEETRHCTRYETRPDFCADYDPAGCGMSTLSNQSYGLGGNVLLDRVELIRQHELISRFAKPSIAQAIADFRKRGMRLPSEFGRDTL